MLSRKTTCTAKLYHKQKWNFAYKNNIFQTWILHKYKNDICKSVWNPCIIFLKIIHKILKKKNNKKLTPQLTSSMVLPIMLWSKFCSLFLAGVRKRKVGGVWTFTESNSGKTKWCGWFISCYCYCSSKQIILQLIFDITKKHGW